MELTINGIAQMRRFSDHVVVILAITTALPGTIIEEELVTYTFLTAHPQAVHNRYLVTPKDRFEETFEVIPLELLREKRLDLDTWWVKDLIKVLLP